MAIKNAKIFSREEDIESYLIEKSISKMFDYQTIVFSI